MAVLGWEPWSDGLRTRIEGEMGVRTYDLIGMTETGGPGMGIGCLAREGIHVWDDHYLPEIIDPETGRVLPDGVWGELVVATLTRQGLPLVRYRTRDVTRVRSRERCPCGAGVRLDHFQGRTDDMVIFKGVNSTRARSSRSSCASRGWTTSTRSCWTETPNAATVWSCASRPGRRSTSTQRPGSCASWATV